MTNLMKISKICDKCGGILKEELLTKDEVKEKLKNLDFEKPPFFTKKLFLRMITDYYVYLKCEKCNWGKFVKIDEVEFEE